MHNFIECDREQEFLLPPSLREWLSDDHLAWFVVDAVDEMDLTAFYGAYRRDGWGRAAFDPQMMVALLLYAYAVGERSSRGVERRCREDVAFRVLAANQLPDHATIARFRARHERALADTFEQVLALCASSESVGYGIRLIGGQPEPTETTDSARRRALSGSWLGARTTRRRSHKSRSSAVERRCARPSWATPSTTPAYRAASE